MRCRSILTSLLVGLAPATAYAGEADAPPAEASARAAATPSAASDDEGDADPSLAADRAKVEVHAEPEQAPTDPDDLPKRVEKPKKDGFLDRFILESARATPLPLDPDFLVFSIHGEYEMRFRALTDLPLQPPARGAIPPADGSPAEDPGFLGQNAYLYHWLRLWGRVVFRDDLVLVGSIDAPRGLIAGQKTQFVDKARDALDTENWYDVHPRELFLEWRSPVGVFRVGQQTSHWGEGILANDGNHPQMFGDTIRGSLVERLLFATTPMGKDTPLLVAAAGDLVFEDNTADILGDSPTQPTGDLAGQAVLAVAWREDIGEVGLYGVYRHQERTLTSVLSDYDESMDVGVVDIAGKIRGKVPGTSGYAYLQAEAAGIFGRSSYLRSAYVNQVDASDALEDESILSFGTSATLGFVHVGQAAEERFGDIVAELEWGLATGDADPYDGSTHRFTFDTSHNVGLVLFDQVMAWKTARAATIAQDERVVGRPSPGLQFLPSQGGVFGSTYLNPRVLLRPVRQVDVKLGMVLAQTTADFVDPYHAGALGEYRNYDGGDPTSHDLGLEIDAGIDGRIPIERTVALELGVEGGVLFPGHAFDSADGRTLPKQMLLNTKLGLQF
ncbi:MAG TPA: hypothetical protein VL400_00470 [Polyangiaceae bacterium]|nr:hypothetical protein [Polyangiaceae bacterium]